MSSPDIFVEEREEENGKEEAEGGGFSTEDSAKRCCCCCFAQNEARGWKWLKTRQIDIHSSLSLNSMFAVGLTTSFLNIVSIMQIKLYSWLADAHFCLFCWSKASANSLSLSPGKDSGGDVYPFFIKSVFFPCGAELVWSC